DSSCPAHHSTLLELVTIIYLLITPLPPQLTLLPYTTLFRSFWSSGETGAEAEGESPPCGSPSGYLDPDGGGTGRLRRGTPLPGGRLGDVRGPRCRRRWPRPRGRHRRGTSRCRRSADRGLRGSLDRRPNRHRGGGRRTRWQRARDSSAPI